jgi:hypothetical protein
MNATNVDVFKWNAGGGSLRPRPRRSTSHEPTRQMYVVDVSAIVRA